MQVDNTENTRVDGECNLAGKSDLVLSVVLPVFNEEASIRYVIEEVHDELDKYSWKSEILVVDDGSSDGTIEILLDVSRRYSRLRIFQLTRHVGQSAALWKGLVNAGGEYIAALDGDGQLVPQDLHLLFSQLASGFDFAIGYRQQRRDTLCKRLFSKLANRIRISITGSTILDSGCSLRMFNRKWLKVVLPFQGFHRFLPTMLEAQGATVVNVGIQHRTRAAGKSKYGIIARAFISFADLLMLYWLFKRLLPDVDCREIQAVKAVAQRVS